MDKYFHLFIFFLLGTFFVFPNYVQANAPALENVEYTCSYIYTKDAICEERCFSFDVSQVHANSVDVVLDSSEESCKKICEDSPNHRECVYISRSDSDNSDLDCDFNGVAFDGVTARETEWVDRNAVNIRKSRVSAKTDRSNQVCSAAAEEKKATTQVQCNLIKETQRHRNCNGIESAALKVCIEKEYVSCLQNCSDCTQADNGQVYPVRTKPEGYTGPIPDCAFSYEGCRRLEDLLTLGINIAKWLFGIIGSLGLLQFSIGGGQMILSFGNQEGFNKGKQRLGRAVVGMLIALGAVVIINFVLDILQVDKSLRIF